MLRAELRRTLPSQGLPGFLRGTPPQLTVAFLVSGIEHWSIFCGVVNRFPKQILAVVIETVG